MFDTLRIEAVSWLLLRPDQFDPSLDASTSQPDGRLWYREAVADDYVLGREPGHFLHLETRE
jgi:hypothetical protein